MALVGVGAATVFRQIAVILSQALRGVVVQLSAAQRFAEGIKSAESDVVRHAHVRGDLQAVVGGGLVRFQQQHGTIGRVRPPGLNVGAGAGRG